jgi:hypothetical protein
VKTESGMVATFEKEGAAVPSSYFLLKGNSDEYINNIDFKRYASLLGSSLKAKGWDQTGYSKAKVFLFLDYGIDTFYERE